MFTFGVDVCARVLWRVSCVVWFEVSLGGNWGGTFEYVGAGVFSIWSKPLELGH